MYNDCFFASQPAALRTPDDAVNLNGSRASPLAELAAKWRDSEAAFMDMTGTAAQMEEAKAAYLTALEAQGGLHAVDTTAAWERTAKHVARDWDTNA